MLNTSNQLLNSRLLYIALLSFLPHITLLSNPLVGSLVMAPDLSVSYKLNNNYALNAKIESFHYAMERDEKNEPLWENKYDGTDIQLFITRRLGPFSRLALGYQYGHDPAKPASHRIIQQYSIIRRPRSVAFVHRLRADQTFYKTDPARFRLRYRLSTEIPLQGQSLDPREFYLLASDEIIASAQNKKYRAENRFVFMAGFMFNGNHKLQVGIDYRSELADHQLNNTLILKAGWNISL